MTAVRPRPVRPGNHTEQVDPAVVCDVLTVRADGRVVITRAHPVRGALSRAVVRWVTDPAEDMHLGVVNPGERTAYLTAQRLAELAGWHLAGTWTLAGRFPAVRVRETR